MMQCNAELNLSCLTHKMIECNRILSVLPKPKVIAPLGNAAGIGAANAEKARALQRVENYELKAKRQAEQSSLRRQQAESSSAAAREPSPRASMRTCARRRVPVAPWASHKAA